MSQHVKMSILPPELEAMRVKIEGYAHEVGLDFPEVRFVMVDFEQMNKIAAYDGFPSRYPHWRFGMEYERMRKSYAWGLHRIYELVINTDPCYAYLLTSNLPIDQKLVMAHVYAHADFFKNNLWFAHTNRRMLDETANHGSRIRRYVEKYGAEAVETFVDRCLSLENLIDIHSPGIQRPLSRPEGNAAEDDQLPERIRSKGYMDDYINPPAYLERLRQERKETKQKERDYPATPQRDLLLFLLENAPLEAWQQDVLAIIREEAYYFAPQRQTKIMNEGWACAVGGTLVSTDQGLMRLDHLVNARLNIQVSDGSQPQQVYDWAIFNDLPTIKMTTRRGFVLEGSTTHRIRLPNGEWRRLDQLKIGDVLEVARTHAPWPQNLQPINWQPLRRMTLHDVAQQAGVHLSSVIRHRDRTVASRRAIEIDQALAVYEVERISLSYMMNSRATLQIPTHLDTDFAAFLGYLIGDGHISRTNRELGLTTGDDEQADRFMDLGRKLFNLEPVRRRDENRWRVIFYSETLNDLLRWMGLTEGVSARRKTVPDLILRSPEAVVRAYLQAYFDCDGYAGEQGVILSTASTTMSEQIQLMLLQFNILSRRRLQRDDCWHVHITGNSALRFAEKIGFGLTRKQDKLLDYVKERQWFKGEDWVDEVEHLEAGCATVYDISVTDTHCYVANGLVNHNSYWHSHIMTRFVLDGSELIDYADHHSGTLATSPGRLNPYKMGIELLRHVEDRWNRGAFGPEYEQCDNAQARATWDRKLGLGREKIFEVRRIYNDVGFIDTFLTEEFAQEQRLFNYRYNPQLKAYEIEGRDFQDIKQQLLFNLTNFGEPLIEVVNANYQNRGELYLVHRWEAVDLRPDYASATLENLQAVWGRPVHLETIASEKGPVLFSYNGETHEQRLLRPTNTR